MESNDKYVKFLEDFNSSNILDNLKASNVASNIVGLDFYSAEILKELKFLDNEKRNEVLSKCEKIIEGTINEKDSNRIDKYIEFGENFKIILPELKAILTNIPCLRKIATHYLDILPLTKDEKIKKLSFEIADELINSND